jgi:predicted dinucleotide-binding enzyme
VKVAILGTGRIGETLARHLVRARHEVALANSRGPDSLSELVAELGAERARADTAEGAVEWSELAVLAIPWRLRDLLPAGDLFAGKIVVDATNPYGEGGIVDVEPSTSSEEVARLMPGARLVKAFNTLNFRPLAERAHEEPPLALFVAGDDAEAKRVVSELIAEIGFAPVDTGSLSDGGRRQQPGAPVYNRPLTADEARALLG